MLGEPRNPVPKQGPTDALLLIPPMTDGPLWSADNQASRLAELMAATGGPLKEAPLRRDIRSLGILLGRVLVEQAGDRLFGVGEQLRGLLLSYLGQLVLSPAS